MAKQDITNSLDRLTAETCSDERISGESTSSVSFNTLRLAAKCQPRVMKLDLITLPQFNVTNIARCLSVCERLQLLTIIHPRLRSFVYHPQCFPDMSFFPVDDQDQFDPKILSSNGSCGITYVEINIFSSHPFVEVALTAGMWNFRADLWDTLRWPTYVNIESLQLTLDHGTESEEIHLNLRPGSQFITEPIQEEAEANTNSSLSSVPSNVPTTLPTPSRFERTDSASTESESSTPELVDHRASFDDEMMQSIDGVVGSLGTVGVTIGTLESQEHSTSPNISPNLLPTLTNQHSRRRPRSAGDAQQSQYLQAQTPQRRQPQRTNLTEASRAGEERSFDHSNSAHNTHCISPTTGKPMDICRLRNLFFIRFESPRTHPVVHFPRSLWGLGLQSFNSTTFAKPWWRTQLQDEQRFEQLRFLVLSCCSFSDNELQMLLEACPNLEHLSMRYVQWEGTIHFPGSLLSLGYFPDKEDSGYYSLDRCTRLWQISTRMNENEDAAIEFVNRCSSYDTIQRVKFELIRKPNFSDPAVNMEALHQWERDGDRDSEFTVAVSEEDLELYSELKDVFPVKDEQFVDIENVRFEDCPLWSDESKDFIRMTSKRKLLLR